jgi:hypothetical protein
MNNFGGESGTTTTHTTITETHVQTNIRWDPAYIKSIPGGLKLGAVVSRQQPPIVVTSIVLKILKFNLFHSKISLSLNFFGHLTFK